MNPRPSFKIAINRSAQTQFRQQTPEQPANFLASRAPTPRGDLFCLFNLGIIFRLLGTGVCSQLAVAICKNAQ